MYTLRMIFLFQFLIVIIRDGRGSFFSQGAGRGGARPKIYGAERGVAGNHPLPTVRGKNLQGWEGPGRGTYCMN